ncbi:hypothetical protein DH96_01985 [Candidatus Phytoplasma oryzae]|uniref:Uncharacterized protein n=1 Tax=Candidatus Phytoplasma oryzae TaxID=203274 RepID=A0A328IR25_9MOLU|nr:hypothetical protein [Candidatus Phytoplasma oryzae]RAM57696.1 hypothetical protein DH96_01985 [Candidatus Phytoplasma oryzae]
MIKKIDDLEQKNTFVNYLIKIREAEVKDTASKTEEKTLLNSLINSRKRPKKDILEECLRLLNNYFKILSEEIQILEEQIKNSKNTEEKYRLKG